MSLSTIADLAEDQDFRRRVEIAAIQAAIPDPYGWTSLHLRELAMTPGLEQKYEAAKANPYCIRPGANPDVISDAEIIGAVTVVAGLP